LCRDGAGTAALLEHLSSPMGFSGVRVARSLVLCVVLCIFLLLLFLLVIVLSVCLRFTDSDYPFGIIKLFLIHLLKVPLTFPSSPLPHAQGLQEKFCMAKQDCFGATVTD
jgi:hypothetical protein